MIRLERSLIHGLQGDALSVQSVCDALQQAVKLEHATIPVYLYALYSLDATKNPEISRIIQSVVMEEMLHMTLASNVLNALGGAPLIGKAGFIPTYPGSLPGGVDGSLTVNLAPFSMTQLQTFLDIEEPENPINYRALPLAASLAAAPVTIGQFYTAISDAIAVLGSGAFFNPARNQVGPELMAGSVVVVDVASAHRAINTIIEQGEGTSISPKEVVGGGYAHYYRFMQVQKGRMLASVSPSLPPDQQYAYSGRPVPFDPAGVNALPTNPTSAGYAKNPAQKFANDNFNYTYSNLLTALNAMFNGQATQEQLNVAIGLMMSLKGQAKAMMVGIPNPEVLTGPSFEYLAVNP
jgi:hypothetical protein